jgi:D-alanyl-D-alanine carboxypeptidase/D-alanyl-D-alanine-endopeptidase (penicillin-binding protein 4)
MGAKPRRRSLLLASGICAGLLVAAPVLAQQAAPAAAADLSAETAVEAGAAPSPRVYDRLPPPVAALLPELTLQPSQVSAYVRQVEAPVPLLAVHAAQARIPASTIKLVTSIAALDLLGPNYQWRTEVLITGDVIAGTLEGDLYIKGYGDPFISTEAYAGLIRAVRAKGIRHIAGDLIFDNSHLVPPVVGRGDFDGAAHRSYNALPAALSLNRQVTFIHLYNDRERGGVGVYTEPPLSHLDIINNAEVVQAPCQGRFHRLSVSFSEAETVDADADAETLGADVGADEAAVAGGVSDAAPTDAAAAAAEAIALPAAIATATAAPPAPKLTITGRFASECPDERIPRLMLSPARHAAAAFDAIWRDLGGSIGGRVLAAAVPTDAEVFHIAYSQPLHEVLRSVNKWSDNLIARMIFLALGIEHAGAPGSTEKSREALQLWLAEHAFSFPELLIDNGSGLSRDTRIAAGSMGELLTWAYHQPWMPELLASMAILGVDGTLAKRMRKEPIEGHAHLKTGTVRDASCIAGYVLDPAGRRWVVVALVNALPDQQLPAWHGHAVHHALLRWVYDGATLPD